MASSTALAIDCRGSSTYRRNYYSHHRSSSSSSSSSPSSLINSVFSYTVKTAARTLLSISSASRSGPTSKWGPTDHLRFMFMPMTWLTLWFLRVLMDHFPSLCGSSTPALIHQLESTVGTASTDVAPFDNYLPLLTSSSSASIQSTLSALMLPSSMMTAGSLDIMGAEESSVNALDRALSHVLGLLSEIPAASRKYQFTMAMADRIMDENAREGHVELLHINRVALASAFARTSGLLYCSLQQVHDSNNGGWPTRVAQSLPLGSYIVPYVKGVNFCIGALLRLAGNGGGGRCRVSVYGNGRGGVEEEEGEVAAEKLAHELLWITTKMRDFGAVDEALEQWSFASGLASATLIASPRVQGFIIKTYAILFGELAQERLRLVAPRQVKFGMLLLQTHERFYMIQIDEARGRMFDLSLNKLSYYITILFGELEQERLRLVAPRQVKFGMLLLWLPLCCHSSNGLTYPILTRLEKVEMERAMESVIATMPSTDQEVILTNWLQDYAMSGSDWPNLQAAYDRWCHCTRKLLL